MNTFLSHVVEIEGVDLKRSRIKPVSDKRRVENKVRAQMMAEKFGPREEWRCSFKAQLFSRGYDSRDNCFGEINGHELRKRRESRKRCPPRIGWVIATTSMTRGDRSPDTLTNTKRAVAAVHR